MEKLFKLVHTPTGAYIHHANGRGYKLLTAQQGAAQFSEAKANNIIEAALHCLPGELNKEEIKK